MSQLNFPILTVFVAYSVAMILIGFYFWKRTINPEDFFLGNRSVGPAVSALSAGASDMSSWLLMGLPGALYSVGLFNSWMAIGLTIGAFVNWSLISKRLRVYTSLVSNSITIPSYFETRFSDDSHVLRIISASVILVFFIFYISAGLIGGAKLFEGTFGIDYQVALFIGAIVIMIYTFLGGYLAVCWTDLIQGVLMMSALIIVPLVMLYNMGDGSVFGGLGEAVRLITDLDEATGQDHLSLAGSVGGELSIVGLASTLGWGLGYFGQPHILVRFMSIKSIRDIPLATFIGISWMIISLVGACAVGLVGFAYVNKFGYDLADPEKIFILMSQELFNPWVAGLLLSALLAAIMSTASSQLLVSSSSIVEDFYRKIYRIDATNRQVMVFSRVAVVVVSVLALLISTDKNSKVLDVVAYAWAGFGASFGSVVLFSLFWRRMTRMGAVAGMLVGAVVVIVHKNFTYQYFPIYEIIPGFLLASLSIVLVSLLQPAKEGTKKAFDTMLNEIRKGNKV